MFLYISTNHSESDSISGGLYFEFLNFSKKLKGLYFTGVTVHPGGGIPLALNSAKIVERCVKDDFEL